MHPGQPRGSHRCLRIGALGPELSIWEGATERAALWDPTQAAHVPRSPTRVYPTLVDSGGLCNSARMPRPKPSQRIASPRSCSPARAPARALPAPSYDSPAPLRGKFGGAAAAEARMLGARRQRLPGRRRSGLERRGRGEEPRRRGPAGEGGGDPGPIRLQRPGLQLRSPRAAPRREGAPQVA